MSKIVAITALVVLAESASAEIIGGYTIGATPVSARQLAGGGRNWRSLNIVNTSVSINDAFSGSPLADDGYANGVIGTSVECTFASGDLVNRPGADLIFVDARFSLNSYNIYIGNDGFTAGMFAGGNPISGDSRDYWYNPGDGRNALFRADLVVYTFDLSDWGIAPGGVVTDVRFVALSNEVDPIGFGAISIPAPGALFALGIGALSACRRRR